MKNNPIQQHLNKVLNDENKSLCLCGNFTMRDFRNLTKVLNNTDEDFIIFDNAGGKIFDIIMDRTVDSQNYLAKDTIKAFLKDPYFSGHIYCYQLNKKQTILKEIR